VAGAEAKFHLDPCNRLATTHQRHRQDRQTGQTGQRSGSIERTVLETVAQKQFALCYRAVVLSVLSVTLVHCGQTVAWIKMPLGTEVGLGPNQNVLDGDPAPRRKGAHHQRHFRGLRTQSSLRPASV